MVWFVFKESRDVEDEKFKINMFNQKTIRRIKFKI
jgi:hypothetical protein